MNESANQPSKDTSFIETASKTGMPSGIFSSGSVPVPDPKGESRRPGNMIMWGLIVVAALFVVFAGIKAAQVIVGPFCLAVFLAVILTAPLRWLKSKGISDLIAALILIAGVVICGMSIIWILSGSVNQFIVRIPEYTVKFNKTVEQIDDWLEPHGFSLLGGPPKTVKRPGTSLMSFLGMDDDSEHSIPQQPGSIVDEHSGQAATPLPDPLPSGDSPDHPDRETAGSLQIHAEKKAEEKTPRYEPLPEQEKPLMEAYFGKPLTREEREAINTVGIVGYIQGAAKELGKLATVCFIVMILVVFMLYEASRLPKKILGAFGTQGVTNEHIQQVVDKVWKYMYIKTIISLCVGFCVWLLLVFAQVEYALLWGLIAFFLNYIPNIGSIIAAVPGIALALFDHGWGTCIVVTVGYLAINQGFGYYVEPIFLGDGLGISPLVVLLSLIFWGWLLGLIGMFLSAPLTIVVKIILDSFDETRWASILMDDK